MPIFDPIIIYDVDYERWVFTVVARDDNYFQSFIYIAVSQSNDPTKDWFYYIIDGDRMG